MKKNPFQIFLEKNIFLIFTFLVFLTPIFFADSIKIKSIGDFELNNDSQIYVGEGEPCESFNIKLNCMKGLECKLISSSGHKTGICMKKGTNLSEDNILRNPLIIADDSDIIKNIKMKNENISNTSKININ